MSTDYFVVCQSDGDCRAEGFWCSVIADRATSPPENCPVCGGADVTVSEADVDLEVFRT